MSDQPTQLPRGQLSIQVTPLFATPVALAMLPMHRDLNPPLREAILARRETHASVRASNSGGWQSDWAMLEWAGPEATTVLDAAQAVAFQLTRDRKGNEVEVEWDCNSWANVNGPGDSNEYHCHPGAFWSGVYYIDDGYAGEDPVAMQMGGQIELLDPRGPGPAMYAPNFAFAGRNGLAAGASEALYPKTGMLLLFPAWQMHQVRPYRGDELRISMAFNLCFPEEMRGKTS